MIPTGPGKKYVGMSNYENFRFNVYAKSRFKLYLHAFYLLFSSFKSGRQLISAVTNTWTYLSSAPTHLLELAFASFFMSGFVCFLYLRAI